MNQTLSFLLRRFNEAGIRPRTKLGQNFLIDLNLLRVLLVARQAAAVVTVEVDPQLFQLAREELLGADNVTMLRADALKNKNRLNPAVLDAVRERLGAAVGRRLKLVANLPFNVATPIISNLLSIDTPPRQMVVTIQKELADRLAASPGTKDYGALSVWVESQCRVETLRTLPPTVFWPRPKVSLQSGKEQWPSRTSSVSTTPWSW